MKLLWRRLITLIPLTSFEGRWDGDVEYVMVHTDVEGDREGWIHNQVLIDFAFSFTCGV